MAEYTLAVRNYLKAVSVGQDAVADPKIILGKPWEFTLTDEARRFFETQILPARAAVYKAPYGAYYKQIFKLFPYRVYSPCVGQVAYLPIKVRRVEGELYNPFKYALGLVLDYDVPWDPRYLDALRATSTPPAYVSLSVSNKFHLVWLTEPIEFAFYQDYHASAKKFVTLWSPQFHAGLEQHKIDVRYPPEPDMNSVRVTQAFVHTFRWINVATPQQIDEFTSWFITQISADVKWFKVITFEQLKQHFEHPQEVTVFERQVTPETLGLDQNFDEKEVDLASDEPAQSTKHVAENWMHKISTKKVYRQASCTTKKDDPPKELVRRTFTELSPDEREVLWQKLANKYGDKFTSGWPKDKFSLEQRGPTFWISTSDSSDSAILKEYGFYTFSAESVTHSPAYTWVELLPDEVDWLSATLGAEYYLEQLRKYVIPIIPRKRYTQTKQYVLIEFSMDPAFKDDLEAAHNYRRARYDIFDCTTVADAERILKNATLRHAIPALEHVSPEQFLAFVKSQTPVIECSPWVGFPHGQIRHGGKLYYNPWHPNRLAVHQVNLGRKVSPADFPAISQFLDSVFAGNHGEASKHAFCAWVRHAHCSLATYQRLAGPVLVLIGAAQSGKSLLVRLLENIFGLSCPLNAMSRPDRTLAPAADLSSSPLVHVDLRAYTLRMTIEAILAALSNITYQPESRDTGAIIGWAGRLVFEVELGSQAPYQLSQVLTSKNKLEKCTLLFLGHKKCTDTVSVAPQTSDQASYYFEARVSDRFEYEAQAFVDWLYQEYPSNIALLRSKYKIFETCPDYYGCPVYHDPDALGVLISYGRYETVRQELIRCAWRLINGLGASAPATVDRDSGVCEVELDAFLRHLAETKAFLASTSSHKDYEIALRQLCDSLPQHFSIIARTVEGQPVEFFRVVDFKNLRFSDLKS